MLYMENHIGTIGISGNYLRELTEQTVLQCFGVAGFSQPTLIDRLTGNTFSSVKIAEKNKQLEITLHVKIVYGVNIPAVANSLIHKVEFVVQDAVRVPVSRVRVFVDEIVER